jgi:hypothetical protein
VVNAVMSRPVTDREGEMATGTGPRLQAAGGEGGRRELV